MTEKELKRLSRTDLLEMLIDQSKELQKTKKLLEAAEAELQSREIAIEDAGSIAEASLRLNGVFEAAQNACQQYMENVRTLSDRQEEACRQREQESIEIAAARLAETERICAEMEAKTKERCASMLSKAKSEAAAYWDEMYRKLEAYRANHAEVRELLNTSPRINRYET